MCKVLAGIVLFNPDIERLAENIKSILPQVEELILVDNNSNNIKEVVNLYGSMKNIKFVLNPNNLGIATALNQIIDYGYQNQYDWALTLDQDSIANELLITKYIDYIHNNNSKKIGIITCNIIDRNFDLENKFNNETSKFIDYCITSGSLMNIDLTKEIGGFDDQMFIDKVDCDICINFRKHGYYIIQINFNGLLHEVGHAKQINLGFRKWELYNHSSFRRYFMCQNAVYLLKKYKNLYVCKIFVKEVFHTILVLIFEDGKIKKLKAGLSGFIHGIFMERK